MFTCTVSVAARKSRGLSSCVALFILIYEFNKKNTVNSLRPSDAYMRRKTDHLWFRYWLVACSVPSHHLNQCCVSFIGKKLPWNFHRNSYILTQQNTFRNVASKMAAILSRPQCVNSIWPGYAYCWTAATPGPRFNIKTVLSTYGDFHVKDKTAVRPSYL